MYKSKLNKFTGNLQVVFDGSLVSVKSSVDTYANLPLSGNTESDLRIARDTDRMYVWTISASSGLITDWSDIGSVTSVDWSAITNKPASAVADIDLAVTHKDVVIGNPHDVKTSEITGLQTTLDDKLDFVESSIGESLGFTAGQKIVIDNHTDFDFGNGSFSIEMWIKFDSLVSGRNIFYQKNDGTNNMYFSWDTISNRWEWGWLADISMEEYASGQAPVVGQWMYFSYSRETTWEYMHINGIQIESSNLGIGYQPIKNINADIHIPYNVNVKISNIRVSNSRRYNSPYTPSAELPVRDANTILLIPGYSPVQDIDGDKVINSFSGSYNLTTSPELIDALVVVDPSGNPTASEIPKHQVEDAITHKDLKNNPHEVDNTDVGLSNVNNTSDADKPISTAQQTALDLKANKNNVLELNNTTSFTPDADYEPATKKYVDDIKQSAIEFIIDGAGSVISTGISGWIEVPFDCTITASRLSADQSGSIVVDIWKDTYANYPPTVTDTITASAKPTLSSAIKSEDTTLTGWTTSVSAGDFLYFNVDSVATIEKCLVSLTVTRT